MTSQAPMTSDEKRKIVVRELDVRTWPERTDVVLIDLKSATALAHYPLEEMGVGACFDPRARFDERAADALGRLEHDQELLRFHWQLPDETLIRLGVDTSVRELIENLLDEYGLALADVELDDPNRPLERLGRLDVGELYELLCDWHDVVERRYGAGESRADPDSWVQRAAPERACLYAWLCAGATERFPIDSPAAAEAYRLFLELVDADLAGFSFGHLLRWTYFHRTEFAGCRRREPAALQQLRLRGAESK